MNDLTLPEVPLYAPLNRHLFLQKVTFNHRVLLGHLEDNFGSDKIHGIPQRFHYLHHSSRHSLNSHRDLENLQMGSIIWFKRCSLKIKTIKVMLLITTC